MAKIIASADHHFDQHSTRWAECLRIHDWIAAQVEERQPDAFLSAGDIYERASTPHEREAVAAWLTQIAAVCPVVIVRGNHDRAEDVALLRRLSTVHPITVEERAAVHYVGDLAICAVAWPSRSMLRSVCSGAPTSEAVDDVAREMLRNVLRGMAGELMDHDGPRILLMHAMVDGSVTSTGQPLVGCEFNCGLSDLALAQCHVAILGHIHKPQRWEHGGASYLYTGSPFRTAFGELEQKSVVMWEDGEITRLTTPAQPMVLLEATYQPGEPLEFDGGYGRFQDLADAEVRARYEVASDQRDAARIAAQDARREMLHKGAASVKLEEVVIATTRTRTPEIAAAQTLPAKLAALWQSRGIEVDEARRQRLFRMLEEAEHAA